MAAAITVISGSKQRTVLAPEGENLLRVLLDNGWQVTAYCGGHGVCGKCRVRILHGCTAPTQVEKGFLTKQEIGRQIRLACMVKVASDMTIEIAPTAGGQILTEGLTMTQTGGTSVVSRQRVMLEKPSLSDQKDFLRRLLAASRAEKISWAALQELADMEKESPMVVTVCDQEIREIKQAESADGSVPPAAALAIDIGTTTIAAYLIDLASGQELAVCSLFNPQARYGADVISRVNFTLQEEYGVTILKETLVEALNQASKQLCAQTGLDLDDIVQVAVAGNTIMLHTFLGISAASIASAPYIPQFTDALEFTAQDLGLQVNPRALVQLLPCISGYVGADIVADLICVYQHVQEDEEWSLLIDIGTNGEIVLGRRGQLLACSAAAGPAFEGANLSWGMAGVEGAISGCRIDAAAHRVSYQVIGGGEARGICGSGIVDAIAELLRNGFLDGSGAFHDGAELAEWQRQLMTEYRGMPAFQLASNSDDQPILVTQKDVREVQLAKGAVASGIAILAKEAGITVADIGQVFLAGGFGSYVAPESACRLGLIPAELRDRIIRIGNGAGTGAKLYALDREWQRRAEELRNQTRYIELSSRADFQMEFMNSMVFTD